MFILNEYARDYFVKTLHEHIEGKSVGLSYFRERGFRDDIIKKFQLGYNLEEKDSFTQEALRAGYKEDYLVKTGLTFKGDNNYLADRFRGRVMFPVHTLSGKVVAFGGRILKKVENTGKYVNSPESDIYHKGNELYGIFFAKQAITKNDCCYLVEGYTDVISMHQSGIENVVASSGTALTHGQIKLIHRFTNNVTVIYDGDAAGIKAALRGIDLLLEEGMNIKVILLPDGEDPDSFAKKQNAESLSKYIAEHEVDFIRFKTQLLLGDAGEDPIKRANLITDIVNSISVIPDNIVRTVYIRDCSHLLEIDEQVLIREVNNKRRNYHDQKFAENKQNQNNSYSKQEEFMSFTPKNGARQQTKKSVSIYKYERAVLYYIVRYGAEILIDESTTENGEKIKPINIIEFIKTDLEQDGLWFTYPLYKQMLDEAIEHLQQEGFTPSRYFLSHPDTQISKIAVDLISDKYQLSKVHIKQFGENVSMEDTPLSEDKHLIKHVPWVLTELKNAYVKQRMDEITEQLKEKQKEGNFELVMSLMTELKELKEVKKMLDKFLGERIVLPK